MIMALWFAFVLYTIVLTYEMAIWVEVLILFSSLAFYFIADYLWEKQKTKINNLEKRINKIENRAITDIVEESPNHYAVKRRLGPDRED